MDQAMLLIFNLVVLLFSVVIHEVSHGFVAERLGDPTARLLGRLTLNPLKHLDFMGSFVIPFGLFFLTNGAFVFGWAKPVPYNPANLKHPKNDSAKIAAAGPASNFILAAAFGIFYRIVGAGDVASAGPILGFFSLIVFVNVLLGVFNLVPIPPLDGSKVLFSILPRSESAARLALFLERYGLLILILFMLYGFRLIMPAVLLISSALIGRPAAF